MTVEQMTRLIENAEIAEAQRVTRVRSKIYGYTFNADGDIAVVPEEAKVIEQIFGELSTITFMSCAKILEEIAKDFRTSEKQTRTRSNRLFTSAMLLKLAKQPIYGGLSPELDAWGRYVRQSTYPAICSESQFRTTIKRLKRESLA